MAGKKYVGRVSRQDLLPGTMKRIDYPPFHVLVVNLAGIAYAIDDTCNHAGESLSYGELCGSEVTCTAHGYLFDVRTGVLVSPKGLCDNQRTFEVCVEGDDFVVYDQIPVVLPPGVR
jgi:3-phenylpropionate/trans-cinnamate dioxygenase ferredoxin subunit